MLLPLLLALLATAPAATPASSSTAPAPRLEATGYVRDARLQLLDDGALSLHARIEGPLTLDRRSFVVETFDAEGRVLTTRTVRACADHGTARRHRTHAVQFHLSLGDLSNVAAVRVRSAG